MVDRYGSADVVACSLGADEAIDYLEEYVARRGETWDVGFDAVAPGKRFRDD